MNAIEKNLVKNAPLLLSDDRTDFVAWAMSIPDGNISAGWQSTHPSLANNGWKTPTTRNTAPVGECKPENCSSSQCAEEDSHTSRGALKPAQP